MATTLPLLVGCDPEIPGSPADNQPPDTRIVAAPVEGRAFDHYVSPDSALNVKWFGSDPDGQVLGCSLQVDKGAWVWNTEGKTTLIFDSGDPDSAHPGRTLPVRHTIRVKAVDDRGLEDPTPATRSFYATNYIPIITEFVADFGNNDTVGPGIAFSVLWSDSNGSGASFRLSVDSLPVTDWDSRSKYQFCPTSDRTILAAVDTLTVIPIDTSALPVGRHKLMVQVKDGGGAVSAVNDSITRTITVADTFRPIVTTIRSQYGGKDYYPDGSVFYLPGGITHFEITGRDTSYFLRAKSYFGGVQAFRHRLVGTTDSTDWSEWGAGSSDAPALPAGSYRFDAQCRDWAGSISDSTSYSMTIVEPTFQGAATIKLLVVDETRDGNGRPGSPSDGQVDSLWHRILELDDSNWRSANWEIDTLDYVNHKVRDVRYVSALDLSNKNLVIWHADDKSDTNLTNTKPFNQRVLAEYLDRGGRLFLCGWDLLTNFDPSSDTVTFKSGFVAKYLRLTGGKRSLSRDFLGMVGSAGYPDLAMDSAKVQSTMLSGLDRCWVLDPAHRTVTIGRWNGAPFDGMGVAMKNFSPLNPWRTITCGFPIYFMQEAAAKEFVRRGLTELLAP